MKKIIYGVLFGFLSLIGVVSIIPAVVSANDDAYWASFKDGGTNVGGNALSSSDSTADTQTGSKLLTTVKTTINWLLGLLATIALVICLYAGFLMVTAAGDDAKHKKGMTILKQAAIGLIIIGCAWMIVSVIFWLIGNMSA